MIAELAGVVAASGGRRAVARTRGHRTGPVMRLVSPGELGEHLKPFVFLDLADIPPGPEGAMRWHPHSGIATLTLILGGQATYRETTGTHGTLLAGGVEWMAAGQGVWHTAAPTGTESLKGFQLWVALPPERELAPPASTYLSAEDVPSIGAARVIIGKYQGVASPIDAPPDVLFLDIRLEPGTFWTFAPPPGHDLCWIAVWRGGVEWSGERADVGELVILDDGGAITFNAGEEVGFVLGSAKRSRSPLHIGNHSVHTSAAALRTGEKEIARIADELRATGMIA